MAVTVDVILPAVTVSGGVAAAIFTALRFNRDDATAIVTQQAKAVESMKALNDELAEMLDRMRSERDELRAQIAALVAILERHGVDERPPHA